MSAWLLGFILVSSVPQWPALWLPSSRGYTEQPKVFWFGANSTGLDSESNLALLARHAVAGYGWEQGWKSPSPPSPAPGAIGHGDQWGADAVAHARAYLDRIGAKHTMLFTYRQMQVALSLYKESAAAVAASHAGWWLEDHETQTKCLALQPWGTSDPLWNFSVPDAADWFVDKLVGDLTTMPELKGGRTAVFFDEIDQSSCGYFWATSTQAVCDGTRFDHQKLQAASNAVLRRMVQKLNDANLIPILNSDNAMAAASDGLGGIPMGIPGQCSLPEDSLVESLSGLQWVRFYEVWPWSNWVYNEWQDSPELYAQTISNAILEAEHGIPTVLHSGWFERNRKPGQPDPACPAPARNITRPGPLGGDVEFHIAAYLIVQSPGTTLSFSSDWMDRDFCWRPEFDVSYGLPLGPAVRTGKFSWARNYTKSQVRVDVSAQRAKAGFVCSQCGSVYLL